MIAPYTLTIEYKEHITKELKNKSTIYDKNMINSKQKFNKANSPAIDSIDFHVNKLLPESDTAESRSTPISL